MEQAEIEERIEDLISSPGGCHLLLVMEEHGSRPEQLIDPVFGMTLLSKVMEPFVPWIGNQHKIIPLVLREGKKLRALAEQLVTTPGIEWLWEPFVPDAQLLIPEGREGRFPLPETVIPSSGPPTKQERYLQWPDNTMFTSRHWDGQSALLIGVNRANYDWLLELPAGRKVLRANSDARVREIQRAEDWHEFVLTYPASSYRGEGVRMVRNEGYGNRPWGMGVCLVPDWAAVARDWDAVHISHWAFLTGLHHRIHTEDGQWTEPWTWGGEHTVWLRWLFDEVTNGPVIDQIDGPSMLAQTSLIDPIINTSPSWWLVGRADGRLHLQGVLIPEDERILEAHWEEQPDGTYVQRAEPLFNLLWEPPVPIVAADMMISLDGYIAGPNVSVHNPGGDGAEALMMWLHNLASWRARQGMEGGDDNIDSQIIGEWFDDFGAVVMGRMMFDTGVDFWGDEPPFHRPVFVLTHEVREPLVRGETTFTFVNDGIEAAVTQARAVVGDKVIDIAGGARTVRQAIRAGLLDALQLHIVPVLLGDGLRLFDDIGSVQTALEPVRTVQGAAATHIMYRVVR